MKPSRESLIWLTVLAAVFLAACESGPAIRSFQDPKTDMAGYRTYDFHENANSSAQASFVGKHLRDAIDREMQGRGYKRAENPELLVNFHLMTKDKLSVSSSPAAYNSWRRGYHWAPDPYGGTEVRSYTEGTLNVDVIDRARSELMWEGVAVGRIKEQSLKDPGPAVNAVIAEIFERYPGRAMTSATP